VMFSCYLPQRGSMSCTGVVWKLGEGTKAQL